MLPLIAARQVTGCGYDEDEVVGTDSLGKIKEEMRRISRRFHDLKAAKPDNRGNESDAWRYNAAYSQHTDDQLTLASEELEHMIKDAKKRSQKLMESLPVESVERGRLRVVHAAALSLDEQLTSFRNEYKLY